MGQELLVEPVGQLALAVRVEEHDAAPGGANVERAFIGAAVASWRFCFEAQARAAWEPIRAGGRLIAIARGASAAPRRRHTDPRGGESG
jgi:hypothetical protein